MGYSFWPIDSVHVKGYGWEERDEDGRSGLSGIHFLSHALGEHLQRVNLICQGMKSEL